MNIAASAAAIPRQRIRELADMAMEMERGGAEIFKLYFGESNLPTPEFIQRAAQKALRDGFTYYTPNAGLFSLREQISRYYQRHHQVTLDPSSEIVVTASGVQAINVVQRCVLDPGDEAIILTPAWPNGSRITSMHNARPIEIAQVLQGGRYTVDFDALESAVSPKTRMLLYTSPSNPLGWVANDEEQTRLLEFARRHKLWLIADEVYERLDYTRTPLGSPTPSILRKATREDAVVVVQSFSKSYCMTGWRLGWIVARKDLADRATQLNEFIISNPTAFVQKAAEAALEWGDKTVSEFIAGLKVNRDLCAQTLAKIKELTLPSPEGAFYLFPRVSGITDSFEFCRKLLQETGVGLAPGVAFGEGGEGNIRICYAASEEVLRPALDRIGSYFASLR